MSKKDMERRRDLILRSLVITVSNFGRGNLIDDLSCMEMSQGILSFVLLLLTLLLLS